MTEKLEKELELYKQRVQEVLIHVKKIQSEHCPDIPLVLGEGVSYCGSNFLLWEEKSEAYWELLNFAVGEYKKAGLWGCVPRTCCGPEDPCWTLCAEKLKHLNELFQEETE